MWKNKNGMWKMKKQKYSRKSFQIFNGISSSQKFF